MCQHSTETSEKFLASVTPGPESEKMCQELTGLGKTIHVIVVGMLSGSNIISCSLEKQFSKY